MKNAICTGIGIAGSLVASLFGGWTAALTTLLIFMAIDYLSGLILAGVFHNSPKTETGALESRAGLKGLIRKFTMLLFVLIGHRLDMAIGANYIRDAVCIAFTANEVISIVENAGLMGIPVPKIITNAIDILKKKTEGKSGSAATNTEPKANE
jgi:toxin secretion/phage lysis holin